MKRTALIAAVAALMGAAPAAAQGYLGVEYGNADLAGTDADVLQGEGEFGWNSGGWGGQVGGSFGNVDLDVFDSEFWTLNGHVYWGGDSWRIGGVVATTQMDFDVEEWAYGVEGQFDLGPNTNVAASLTAGEIENPGETFDTWNLDASFNFYFNPNLRVGATAGTGNIQGDLGFDEDSTSLGVNGEFRPWAAPISITLGWNYFDFDGDEFDTAQIGARWNFGAATVQERNGAVPFTTTTGYRNRVYGIY
jgi:hypothetical protein